jgi:hypothetical protein
VRERAAKVTPPWPPDCGWGAPDSAEYAGIHFKRSIASSLAVVDEKASARDPRLGLDVFWHLLDESDDPREKALRLRKGDIREYLKVLVAHLPGLDWSVCEQYAGFVERARTPGLEFTEREYRTFVGVLLDVVRRIEHGGDAGSATDRP